MYYFDWTYLLVLAGLILGMLAEGNVKSTFAKYRKQSTRNGIPAEQIAQSILQDNGNQAVQVMHVHGSLTDSYNPATETLSLSDDVYGSSSVAAIGVAAHEAGHAMQKMDGYALLRLRTVSVPVVNIGSRAAIPVFFMGMIFSLPFLETAGIVLFSLSVLFSLITLPVEFNASSRGLAMLRNGGWLTEEELSGAEKVLRAAALTYVASFAANVLNLLRLIMLSNSRRRR